MGRVAGEGRGEGKRRRQTVGEQKADEERRLETRLMRGRIPTDVLARLQRKSNLALAIMLGDGRVSPQLRTFVEWERDYRRAHGVLLVDTFDENEAIRIEDFAAYAESFKASLHT